MCTSLKGMMGWHQLLQICQHLMHKTFINVYWTSSVSDAAWKDFTTSLCRSHCGDTRAALNNTEKNPKWVVLPVAKEILFSLEISYSWALSKGNIHCFQAVCLEIGFKTLFSTTLVEVSQQAQLFCRLRGRKKYRQHSNRKGWNH